MKEINFFILEKLTESLYVAATLFEGSFLHKGGILTSFSFISMPDPPSFSSASIRAIQTEGSHQRDRPRPLPNSAASVVVGAVQLLNFADLLGLESENAIQSQQG